MFNCWGHSIRRKSWSAKWEAKLKWSVTIYVIFLALKWLEMSQLQVQSSDLSSTIVSGAPPVLPSNPVSQAQVGPIVGGLATKPLAGYQPTASPSWLNS